MVDEPCESTQAVLVDARADDRRQPPPWWAQVVKMASTWAVPALLAVHMERGRAGLYELVDFLLLLLGSAASGERSLTSFCQAVEPVQQEFTALWGRNTLPDASTLSRALEAAQSEPVNAVRSLFFRT